VTPDSDRREKGSAPMRSRLCVTVLASAVLLPASPLPARVASPAPAAVALTLADPSAPVRSEPADTPVPSPCPSGTRATGDRADVRGGSLVHVVYLVPKNKADESLDRNGILECSLRAQQEWFGQQTGLRWRFDTYEGLIDITYVKSNNLNAADLDNADEISAELRRRGFDRDGKRYLTYVASGPAGLTGSAICGSAYYPERTGTGPVDGKYAQVYLDSGPSCRARDFGRPGAPSYSEVIAQQELMHNDGIVPLVAPHQCAVVLYHVCTATLSWLHAVAGDVDPESVDIMFPYVGRPLGQKVVDVGHDDYFAHPNPMVRRLEESDYLEPA